MKDVSGNSFVFSFLSNFTCLKKKLKTSSPSSVHHTGDLISILFPAVVILNVLGFYDPLRDLIRSAIRTGFIQPQNDELVTFVDGPSELSAHASYDWGTPALEALESWKKPAVSLGFDWTKKLGDKEGTGSALDGS